MSGVHYSSRAYQAGDEDAINELYFQVTGRVRTREQWAWQWQQAPAGPGDIWLIEATHPDGRVELIGHHGIMPVRFTWGEKDLLFGKTENTMVLPEYRQKILYPRFERRFAKEYEPRYHALFSTTGPAAAIRQREAMNYEAKQRWVYLEHAYEPLGSLVLLARHPRLRIVRNLTGLICRSSWKAPIPAGVSLLTAEEAQKEPFLVDYWARARGFWGVAPSRAAADLTWRYWENPYAPYYAVLVKGSQRARGNALVIIEHYAPGAANIADFSADEPNHELLLYALSKAIDVAKKKLGVSLVTCLVTDDTIVKDKTIDYRQRFSPSLISNFRRTAERVEKAVMPRKITERGMQEHLPFAPWNVTLAVSEGRR